MTRKPDLYRAVFPVARFLVDRKFNREVEGIDNLPDQPVLLAPNHIQFIDSVIVAASYVEATGRDRLLRFGAKQDYFDGKGIDNHGKYGRLLRFMMEYTGQLPVDREGRDPRAFLRLQSAIKDCIERGDSVAMHPEGTRSTDGKLHKFRSGVGRIALALELPIMPVGLVYTRHSNDPKDDVRVMFGEPVMPAQYKKLPYTVLPNRQKAEHLTKVVEDRVAALTGMEQTGIFAVLKKHRPPESAN